MKEIKLTHKLQVYKDGSVPYDVAVGDVVAVEYANSTFSGAVCVGKLVEVGLDHIVVDSSSQYVSQLATILIDTIDDIKPVKK